MRPGRAVEGAIRRLQPYGRGGRIREAVGLLLVAEGLVASVGEVGLLHLPWGEVPAEVVGFRGEDALLMPLGEVKGVQRGALVEALQQPLKVGVGPGMVGRVVGPLGEPLDGGPLWEVAQERVLEGEAPAALERAPIRERLLTGVRAIDHLLTLGKGQRVGIFAGSGVGKSTLLGMIARRNQAPVTVVALIGERGREVREFLEEDLGEEGRPKSVVVVATSDQPALLRIKAAHTATAIAEYFRDQGQDVVLMMDSLTRFAMALREVGLAAGEPPTTRGYTPSVFAALPRLVERAGPAGKGSITAFYTVLVEGDDFQEPVADAVRGLLDGHIVLSRRLAQEHHYPAIDILESLSRLMPKVVGEEELRWAGEARRILATYRDAQDLIHIGAYQPGRDPEIDRAVALRPRLMAFLRQGIHEPPGTETLAQVLGEGRP